MTLRGVLIGCGYISENQLQAWTRVHGADIVAVCDLDRTKAEMRAEQFNISGIYTDYQTMFDQEKPDFVDIATRPDTHVIMTKAAAERGIQVLCQKPFTTTLDEAQAVVQYCREANVRLMINENFRFQPWHRDLKHLLDAGEIGAPYYMRFATRARLTMPTFQDISQPYFKDMPKMVVYEMGVHYLDTARYLFGEADSVVAQLKQVSPQIAGEDVAVIMARFGDVSCLIDMSWASVPEPGERKTWGTFEIEGTDGTAILHWDASFHLRKDTQTREKQYPDGSTFQGFVNTQQHFIDCLQTGQEFETSGFETLKTMDLVYATYRSAAEGQVIPIDHAWLYID